ncbi:ankyrin repeat domain-containing protein [Fusarium mundagurra]|uniref:Ankyrin repeat domain-containing protein n=1 Tax=Fusarium mundagurra TaxID=1567541 RepID=A0A8H5YFH8_9HYPO|nr:ankyrin repeat domain-containing protein [Fusarium mundagurra]
MTYTSRHMRRPGRRPALYYYIRFGSRDTPPRPIPPYRPQLFKRSKEDESQLKELYARHSRNWSQTDAQAFEDIMDRDAARKDASRKPLRLIIYSYFEHLNLPPLPPPLPGCSTSVQVSRAENHSNESVRPFMVACDKGLLDKVKAWTEDGERIEELQQLGLQDGLVYAARANHIEVVRYLLDERWTPLNGEVVREACDNLSLPLFELCVQHGYHPNQQIPSRDGHIGVALNHCVQDVDITRFLLEHGADPDLAPFKDGRLHDWGEKATPPMDRTSGLALDLAVEKSPMIVVQMLLEHGAHPQYSRPLHGAIKRLHCHSIPDAQTDWRPLMEMALRYGAEINARTYSGGTALSRAVHLENWEIVEFLIEKGADPFVKCPASKHDSFDSALKFEDQPWQRSKEVKEYLKGLMSGSKLEIGGEAIEEARKNPLVRIIEKVKSRDAARLDSA